MRIIAGTDGGRRLATPRGRALRPTSDRAREAVFSMLGDAVHDAVVLDACAGTGAMGLEALSRGACSCTFVDNDPAAVRLIQRNLQTLSARGARHADTAIVHAEIARWVPQQMDAQYSIIVCDPPYAVVRPMLPRIVADFARLLKPGGRIVVESAWRDGEIVAPMLAAARLAVVRQRRYGDCAIVVATLEAPNEHDTAAALEH